jgi:hypothetical protein
VIESHNGTDALDERYGGESDRAFELCRRRQNLSFRHHAEVQGLDSDEQDGDPFAFCRRAITRHFTQTQRTTR